MLIEATTTATMKASTILDYLCYRSYNYCYHESQYHSGLFMPIEATTTATMKASNVYFLGSTFVFLMMRSHYVFGMSPWAHSLLSWEGKLKKTHFSWNFDKSCCTSNTCNMTLNFLLLISWVLEKVLEEVDSWCQKHISEIENGKNKSGQSYFLLKLSNSTTYAA